MEMPILQDIYIENMGSNIRLKEEVATAITFAIQSRLGKG